VADRPDARGSDAPRSYDVSTYGERIADVYDDLPRLPASTERAVEFLAAAAGRGPILELGIGTGRLALPLVQRGFAVHGIDASAAMVGRLRTEPGGDRVTIAMGDFADVSIPGRFSLIFVAFNTFFGLLTQEAQIRCFRGIAEHLADDGVFVMEAFVPDLSRFTHGQRVAQPTSAPMRSGSRPVPTIRWPSTSALSTSSSPSRASGCTLSRSATLGRPSST
jgi:SAM-dependent methyltransferase